MKKRLYPLFAFCLLFFWMLFLFFQRGSLSHLSPDVSFSGSFLDATGEVFTGFLQKKTHTMKDNKAQVLEQVFAQHQDKDVLINLIQEYAKNYQFSKAESSIHELIATWGEKSIDANTYLYVYLNSDEISPSDPQSINKILPLLDKYTKNGMLSSSDVSFYKGLIDVWNHRYDDAKIDFSQSKSSLHQQTISTIHRAIISYNPAIMIPLYYQDGLVALTLLKNGYFTIAKKLSLDILAQNDTYILPYQILAYAHFLTNNWDTAAEYFLKLSDFDPTNKEMYTFLIGVSYYRNQKWTNSILYLNQVTVPKLMTDTYRYLLEDYFHLGDTNKFEVTWQRLLGQNNILGSDFSTFFLQKYYATGLSQRTNPSLGYITVTACYDRLGSGEQDVCRFGDIGNQLEQGKNIPGLESQLMDLASRYHQPFLYKKLGDVLTKQGDLTGAQDAYLRAFALQNPVVYTGQK